MGVEPITAPDMVEEKEPPSFRGRERTNGQTGEAMKRTTIQADDSEIRRKREKAQLAARRLKEAKSYATQQEQSQDSGCVSQPVLKESHSSTHGSLKEEKERSEKSHTGSNVDHLFAMAVEPSDPVLPLGLPPSVPAEQPESPKESVEGATQPGSGNEESHQFQTLKSEQRELHYHPVPSTPDTQCTSGEVLETTVGTPPQSLGQGPPPSTLADQPESPKDGVELKEEPPKPNGEGSHQFRRRNATRSERRGLHHRPVSPTPDPQCDSGEVKGNVAGTQSQSLGPTEEQEKYQEGGDRSLDTGSTLGSEQQKHNEDSQHTPPSDHHSPIRHGSKEESEKSSAPVRRRRMLVVQSSKPTLPQEPPSGIPANLSESPKRKVEPKEAHQPNDGDENQFGSHRFRRRNATRSERKGFQGAAGARETTRQPEEVEKEGKEEGSLQRGSTLEGGAEMRRKRVKARLAARRGQRDRHSATGQQDQEEEPELAQPSSTRDKLV